MYLSADGMNQVIVSIYFGVFQVYRGNYKAASAKKILLKNECIAGKIWMLCGVLEIIVGCLPIAQFEIVTIALILLATIPVAVYSYLLYRKKMG